jgi:hypothetical protein
MSDNQKAQYSDLTSGDVIDAAEVIGEAETNDYQEFVLLQPGVYVNPSRTIKAKMDNGKPTGTFEITFTGGLFREGKSFGGTKLRTWISTKLYEQEGRPGKTSGVAEYLKRAGFQVKGLTGPALVELLAESQSRPIGAGVSWTNTTERNPETGEYGKEFAKTKDFNVGTKDEPMYVPEVEINGQKVQARHRVSYFTSIE